MYQVKRLHIKYNTINFIHIYILKIGSNINLSSELLINPTPILLTNLITSNK